jgi:DNA-binding PadR family transcriptional regulator
MMLTGLGISVLALLAERPMHPYEMYQLLVQRREDRIVKVRPGSLYHTVDRLAEQKLVRAKGTDREGNRPERTMYESTTEGEAALSARITDILATPIREYPLFPIALAESHNLPASEVAELLKRRIELLHDDIDELEAVAQVAREHDVPRVFWLAVEYTGTIQNAEAKWLSELVGQIETGELPWLLRSLDNKK